MANQFLIKNTMQDMKALGSTEIAALESGTYAGVQLLGYHEKGDTPAPIEYYISSTTGTDDGGSIILVGSTKFEHSYWYGRQWGCRRR